MNTILIVVAVIIILSVIAYFAVPKFRKWILGLLASLGFIAGVVVTPEIPTLPEPEVPVEVDDSVEVEEPELPVVDSTEVEPVITYKEIQETQSIPFTTSKTDIARHSRTGQEGILQITYRITLKDGEQVKKEKIAETIIKQPVNAIEYIEPEPEVEPEHPAPNNRKIDLEFPDTDDALTQYLRDSFKHDSTVYNFPEGSYKTLGILDSDEALKYHFVSNIKGTDIPIDTTVYIRTGKIGIVPIRDRNLIVLQGNNTELYNNAPAVWDGDYNDDGFSEPGYDRRAPYLSQRKFIKIDDSKYIGVFDLKVRSSNTKPRHKSGRPEYENIFEFEHMLDARTSQFLYIDGLYARGLWGDGVYIRDTDDVYIRDVTIDWNGRQGGALISGNRGYIENYYVTNSRRAGFDIEGNYTTEVAEDFIVTYSKFSNHLLGIPMGGRGLVRNVMMINNEFLGATTFSKGNGVDRLRENIIFANSKSRDLGAYSHTKNILIDGIEQDDLILNNLHIGEFYNSSNIHIRNINIKSWGRRGAAREAFPVVISVNTPIEEFHVYDNNVRFGVQFRDEKVLGNELEPGKWYAVENSRGIDLRVLDSTMIEFGGLIKPSRAMTKEDLFYDEYRGDRIEVSEFPIFNPVRFPKEYKPTKEEKLSIPFKTSEYIEFHWERLYLNGKGWRDENYMDDGWRPKWAEDIIDLKNAG
jgi:hypothetical protein